PQLLEAAEPRLTDPRRTWISFVHRPDDGNNSKRRCKGKDKKLRGLVGPPGPPGPQGPPGAPGAEVTREVLLQEFKEILKGKRFRKVKGSKRVLKVKAGRVLLDLGSSPALSLPQPLAKGAFLRGSGLNLATGRFTAPVGGIYQFSANIHIDHSELKSKVQLRARDNVRVLICIESLCHTHTSLEVIAGLESNSKIFTIHVHGLLQLQAGQYTSIFVDNSAGAPLTIQQGSDFMGMLMGA
ncbi:ADIPL protein, partial [Brachypodius atriceps]|nr:ADIPL protein [Brachypodius atriceps]